MNALDFLKDIAENAPVDRAGSWLIEASGEFPELFDLVIDNLDADPLTVKQLIVSKYPLAFGIFAIDSADDWIQKLQAFFKMRGY